MTSACLELVDALQGAVALVRGSLRPDLGADVVEGRAKVGKLDLGDLGGHAPDRLALVDPLADPDGAGHGRATEIGADVVAGLLCVTHS